MSYPPPQAFHPSSQARQPQVQEPETPTVQPLRITKSPASSPPQDNMSSNPASYYYPPPRAPQNVHGGSASAAATSNGHPSHAYASSLDAQRYASSTSPRPHFAASDPHRPTVAGYGQPPTRHGDDDEEDDEQTPSIQTRYAQRLAQGQSPSPVLPESPDGLFQKPLQRVVSPPEPPSQPAQSFHAPPQPSDPSTISSPTAAQFYYPPPSASSHLRVQQGNTAGVNRLASTASVSTTRASRGSPPPPETPIEPATTGSGIEARYAAAGIAGPDTLNSLQAQSLAAAQRRQVYAPTARQPNMMSPPPMQTQRRWTPTEQPGAVHPALVTAQDAAVPAGIQYSTPPPSEPSRRSTPRESALEQDMQRLQVSEEPPPAYSSVSTATTAYPVEKRPQQQQQQQQQQPNGAPSSVAGPAYSISSPSPQPSHADHPAFANDNLRPQQEQARAHELPIVHSPTPSTAPSMMSHQSAATTVTAIGPQPVPSPAPSRASPPPLPEGWISHLDENSGQYYYIHLPTQSTQWEFPKGPTPLSLNEPPLSPTGTIVGNPFASPTASVFSGHPLASPGLPPERQSTMSLATITSPTAASFSSLPPTSGVDTYRVVPANGVYFGPYLRYTNMDVDNGIWYGSILLVTDAPHPPTIHIHQSVDLSPNPRQLKANHIFQHQRWSFYRYDIDLRMEEDRDAKWTYAVTSHLGCTRYEFLVAARYETSWRFIGHSGNDFALNVSANERTKLGGVTHMWKDIMQKHLEVGGFHAQLGLGNQIYADRMWKEIPSLKQWTNTSGKENRKNAQWTAAHDEDVTHAYFHYYTSHFDQPHLREAFAQIPHILALDDHDIFDGFGSYPEHMQFSNMFRNIGRIGVEMYLLFQHHTSLQILRNVTTDFDLFTITGTGWHFIKYLGPAMVVVAPDTRSERNQHQVMAGPTYQGLFPKVAVLPPHVQHAIWMVPVPLIYPRLESAESFAQTMATGKKAVTGTFNAVSKITSGVAGIVGAKGMVGEGFSNIKKAVGKSGLMSNVLSPFGEIDILDELRDQWTHESKDLERTYFIRTLQGISQKKSLRMTFFSGAANCCGAGLVHDPSKPGSHKTMYQVISSSVVNAPPASYVLKLLHPSAHNNKPIYLPQNGQRSGPLNAMKESDTKEDMLDVFTQDVTGQPREMKRLMGRRNYIAVVAYDPEALQDAYESSISGKEPSQKAGGQLNLAIDFFVQADGSYSNVSTMKYGPLTIPALAPGH